MKVDCVSMSDIGASVKNYISKDNGYENESSKLLVLMRLINIVMFFFNIFTLFIGIGLYSSIDYLHIAIVTISSLIVLFTSYKMPRRVFLFISNTISLLAIVLFVLMFGWGAGIQNFLFILLVLTFFATYKAYIMKTTYVVGLIALRIALYLFCQQQEPFVQDAKSLDFALVVASTIVVFVSISLVSFVYGFDTQKVESKLVEYNVKLENEANTDSLTGLPNRRCGVEYMETCIKNAVSAPLCIAMCDIDFFKKVNDNYGHDVGDAVLKGLADTLLKMTDENTFVCRWGGEEFIIIFRNINGDDAFVKLSHLMNQIRKLSFKVLDKSFGITVTMGLEEYSFYSSVEEFIKKADEKLYYGKEHGRNQIVF